ncbi:hypothetical protein YC2023_083322 [Brassica napus]
MNRVTRKPYFRRRQRGKEQPFSDRRRLTRLTVCSQCSKLDNVLSKKQKQNQYVNMADASDEHVF